MYQRFIPYIFRLILSDYSVMKFRYFSLFLCYICISAHFFLFFLLRLERFFSSFLCSDLAFPLNTSSRSFDSQNDVPASNIFIFLFFQDVFRTPLLYNVSSPFLFPPFLPHFLMSTVSSSFLSSVTFSILRLLLLST